MTELQLGPYKGAELVRRLSRLKWWVRCRTGACVVEFSRFDSTLRRASLVQCEDCAQLRRLRERKSIKRHGVPSGKVYSRRGCICAGMGANCRTPPLACGCPDPIEEAQS